MQAGGDERRQSQFGGRPVVPDEHQPFAYKVVMKGPRGPTSSTLTDFGVIFSGDFDSRFHEKRQRPRSYEHMQGRES